MDSKPCIIRVRLERISDGTQEEVEVSSTDVLNHHMPGTTYGWDDICESDQTSFAEDYALWAFKRKIGDMSDYRVDVL